MCSPGSYINGASVKGFESNPTKKGITGLKVRCQNPADKRTSLWTKFEEEEENINIEGGKWINKLINTDGFVCAAQTKYNA